MLKLVLNDKTDSISKKNPMKLGNDVKQRANKTTKNVETMQSRKTIAAKQRKISQGFTPR